MKNSVLFSCVLIVFSGCANPYAEFYTDLTGGLDVLSSPNFFTPTGEPNLVKGLHAENDARRMLENGYGCIGISSFNAANVNTALAIAQARNVHADTVIVYSAYTGTVSGSMPINYPDTQTTTGFHSGSIYGPGTGYGSYSGSSYYTTYGTKTMYVPYNIHRFDYLATYWLKLKQLTLGVHLAPLTDEIRKVLGSNKGAYVNVVVKGSPAFYNDVLAGDVIRKVNNEEVLDVLHLQSLLNANKGKEIRLELFRNGETIVKKVKLN